MKTTYGFKYYKSKKDNDNPAMTFKFLFSTYIDLYWVQMQRQMSLYYGSFGFALNVK